MSRWQSQGSESSRFRKLKAQKAQGSESSQGSAIRVS